MKTISIPIDDTTYEQLIAFTTHLMRTEQSPAYGPVMSPELAGSIILVSRLERWRRFEQGDETLTSLEERVMSVMLSTQQAQAQEEAA